MTSCVRRLRIGFDGVSARFGQVQARFNAIEARFDSVEKRLATIDDRIGDEARATRRHVDVVAEEFKHYREILAVEEAAARSQETLAASRR